MHGIAHTAGDYHSYELSSLIFSSDCVFEILNRFLISFIQMIIRYTSFSDLNFKSLILDLRQWSPGPIDSLWEYPYHTKLRLYINQELLGQNILN